MRQSLPFLHERPILRLSLMILALGSLLLWLSCLPSLGHAQAFPITPSGLNTQVSGPITVGGSTQINITGGTRAGTNLFHSFGEFGVPTNNIANFLNETPNLATSNILGRVTGGNPSNIFGTLQTTGFENANLFLVNPAGIVFGPNATLNVGGSVTFTTANNIRLADPGIFHADTTAPSVLTSAPVAAFGFLGSNPGAITVQGSQLSVTEGAGISLVGGNITIEPGTLTDGTIQTVRLSAPGGQINLASVASLGELPVSTFEPPTGMALGSITLNQGSLLDVGGNAGGTVRIRGGSLVIDNAAISADTVDANGAPLAIDINVTENLSITNVDAPALTARTTGAGNAGEIRLSTDNLSVVTAADKNLFFSAIDTHTSGSGNAGNVSINTGSLAVAGDLSGASLFIDSGMRGPTPGRGGDVTIAARSIDLNDTLISTGNFIAFFMDEGGAGTAGNVSMTADRIQMTFSQIVTDSNDFVHPTGTSGDITIAARDLTFEDSALSTSGNERSGAITIIADQFVATESQIQAITNLTPGGDVRITGNVIEFRNGSNIASSTMGDGDAGPIIMTATDHIAFLEGGVGGRPSGIFNNSFGLNGSLGKAGDIVITTPSLQMTGGARINTSTATSGRGGNVTITANLISMSGENGGFEVEPLFNLGTTQSSGIFTSTVGGNCIGPCGNAGNISISTGSLSMGTGSQINSGTSTSGQGGSIAITAGNTISISGTLSTGQPGGIQSRAIGSDPDAGSGGNIALTAGQSVTISDGAAVSAGSTGPGNAGNITIQGPASPAQSILISGAGSGLFATTEGEGSGGTVNVWANDVQLADSATISANTTGAGNAGEIVIQAGNASLSGFSLILSNTTGAGQAGTVRVSAEESISLTESAIFSGTTSISPTASGGQINLTAPVIDIALAQLNTLTTGPASAGDITLATNRLNLMQESEVNASTGGLGRSGNITIRGLETGSKAQDVMISGSSFVVSETLGDLGPAGDAGTLLVETARLTMQEGGSLRTSSRLSSPGNAGTVTINASESIRIMSGSSIESTSIEGSTGNAGDIVINAGQQFEMSNSSVKTEAAQASGGNIDIQAIDRIRLVNSSISTSVLGGAGSGGNITIDPNVVILQNSQIIAQAVQGAGGNISIVTPLFLADAGSLVDASSQFGLSGTVNIQSPTSNLAGTVSSLPSSLRQVQSLQTGRCAALADSRSSSLIVAGRDILPAEPGGWSPSPFALIMEKTDPLALAGEEISPLALSSPPVAAMIASADAPVSLRRLTPAGFLTQSFAESGLTGCRA